MNLDVAITRTGMAFGRRALYTAKLGQWEETGPSQAKAKQALMALIARLAAEDGTPVVKLDARGGVWVTQRQNTGAWSYYHIDQQTGARRCVCLVSGDRARCVEMMEGHMRQWCEP